MSHLLPHAPSPAPAGARRRVGAGLPALAVVLALLAGSPAVCAREGDGPEEKAPPSAQPGDTIAWVASINGAFERARELGKPVMICINARYVEGRNTEEPAAKGLREVVYLDPRIVTKSRNFVCVFLTKDGNSADYGELRARLAMDGLIVSPQHVFALPDHKDGTAPVVRKEYWPYGKGEEAVKALLEMMDQTLAAHHAKQGTTPPAESGEAAPAPAAEAPPVAAPEEAAARTEWIANLLGLVRTGSPSVRRESLQSLVRNDQAGDCTTPVIALLTDDELKKNVEVLTDVIRALGRPDLMAAAAPIGEFLKHREDILRANAAVSLEYIGCPDSVRDLTVRAKAEKEVAIANHMYRALGRCGAQDSKVRALLLKEAKSAESDLASFGPIVGLAYFVQDDKAARGAEKLLKQMGPPGGGRRGGWGQGTMQRGMLAWCLAEIGDPKSAAFMREEMIGALEHTQAFWKNAVVAYYEAVARTCEGDAEAKGGVDEGIRRTLEFAGGTTEIRDAARRDRDVSRFEPKAEWELGAVGGGGGPGGGGGGG